MRITLLLFMATLVMMMVIAPVNAKNLRVFGDRVIQEDEVINGDVIAITGNLVVKGQVTGSVIAYLGDITLRPSAQVIGDVIAKRGKVYRFAGAQIAGNIIEKNLPDVSIGRDDPVLGTAHRKLAKDYDADEIYGWTFGDESDIEVDYTKVDGLYLGMAFDRMPFSDYGVHFRSFGSGGYAFASQRWQGQIGFGVGAGIHRELELSIDAFSLSHTEDAWYMSDMENSLVAFFLHEDFRDYYLKEGFGITLSLFPVDVLSISGRYQTEQHQSLENDASWALFGGEKEFLPNLPIEEGMLREFVISAELDTRDDNESPSEGWWLQSTVELTNPNLASDFDYRRAIVDLRRYQPLTYNVNFDTRIRLGNSGGILPVQKRFYLGGPSTLPGFGLKTFSGREFALFNSEIRLHDDDWTGLWIFDELSLIFFADVGMAADTPLRELKTGQWASDVGIGIGSNSGNVRLQVAKRTDTSDDPYTFMFRIERPF